MTDSTLENREWHLTRRPEGGLADDDVALVSTSLPPPEAEQVRVRNAWLSVDPYMRGRMRDVKSYVPPFGLNEPMTGGAIGVVESVGDGTSLEPGQTVLHQKGWRTAAVLAEDNVRALGDGGSDQPPQRYLGVLGMPGLTAYVGLLEIGGLNPGETVFVSAAAGAVGSAAVQIARASGASTVIGSAGGPEKSRGVRDDLGADVALDYRAEPIANQLMAAADDGIDVYFDNVGGDHLEAALTAMRTYGRVVMCGAISQYNATTPEPGPRNLFMAVSKRLRLQGFIINDHDALHPAFERDMTRWLDDGAVTTRETVRTGIESAPDAFRELFTGGNIGKMLIQLDHPTRT
ncbi:MAG TPA: NADP-dependent oxidoreductase [Jiangellaceae bacterium]|nr:NADP-dependent oxidoreductase [Jiangellaceae bacterium]